MKQEIASALSEDDVSFIRSHMKEERKGAADKEMLAWFIADFGEWAKRQLKSFKAVVAFGGRPKPRSTVIISTIEFEHGASWVALVIASFKKACVLLKEGRILAATSGKELEVKLFAWMQYFSPLPLSR